MPFARYHDKKFKKCKYCDKEAARNIKNGRNKGHYTTCGNEACVKANHNDSGVKASRLFSAVRTCEKCFATYNSKGVTQRWCSDCVPNQRFRALMQRYGVNKKEWDNMYLEQSGKCKLCSRKAVAVDHDHKTGKVGGILCHGCNLLVGILERDMGWVTKTLVYIKTT